MKTIKGKFKGIDWEYDTSLVKFLKERRVFGLFLRYASDPKFSNGKRYFDFNDFTWTSTEEGFDFWRELACAYREDFLPNYSLLNQTNLEIVFTVGLPASGKSTWSKAKCENDTNWVRICGDDLRNMRGQYWVKDDEGMITDWTIDLAESALNNGKNVIIDAMHLREEYITEFMERINVGTFTDDNGKVIISHRKQEFLGVRLDELLKRNEKRGNTVSNGLITRLYAENAERLDLPRIGTGIIGSTTECIIVDIDGTVADRGDRNPHDLNKVSGDKPHKDIIKLVRMYLGTGHKIIFMSGRDEICRADTEIWLSNNFGSYEALFMRSEGDQRKDSIVKLELYLDNIYGNYNIHLVIDDRNQVVDMWRNVVGLRCLQVAKGDF